MHVNLEIEGIEAQNRRVISKMDEIERNTKIINYLVKNPAELAGVFDSLEQVGFVNNEHRVMLERFKQMVVSGVSYEAVINMLKEFGYRAPKFFALFVSIAVYRLYADN